MTGLVRQSTADALVKPGEAPTQRDDLAMEAVTAKPMSRRSLLLKAAGVGAAVVSAAGVFNRPRDVLAAATSAFPTLRVDSDATFTAGPVMVGGPLAVAVGPGGFFVEAEGAMGISSQPASAWYGASPPTRLRLHHPGSGSVPAGDLTILPYEYGMAFSYPGLGPLEFYSAALSAHGSNGSNANFWVGDEGDFGGLYATAHKGGGWFGETYSELASQRFDFTSHGSLRLRVRNNPRTVTDAVTDTSNNVITSAMAHFTLLDIGRRIVGIGIPAGTYVTALISSSSVNTSATSTTSASGATATIGTDSVEVWAGGAGSEAKQLALGAVGAAAQAGLVFGAQEDTNLYRLSQSTLQTDGKFFATGNIRTSQTFQGNHGARGDAYLDAAGTAGEIFLRQNGVVLVQITDSTLNLGAGIFINAPKGVGFWGVKAPASQPRVPVTLADVIAVIRGCGLSA